MSSHHVAAKTKRSTYQFFLSFCRMHELSVFSLYSRFTHEGGGRDLLKNFI